MALSDEQIIDLFNEACREKFNGLERFRHFARAIEAEVRKDDEALIRQMESALSWSSPHADAAHGWKSKNWARKRSEAITAARARLLDSDLSNLTERGAKAWTGVDAQALREGGASPSANAGEPSAHIKEPYTLAEIKAKIASNDYSAEMLLQHAMLLLDSASLAASAGEPVAWRYVDARGHFRYVGYKPSRDMAAEYPLLKPIRLYLHPSPPEGMVATDAMIDAGKKMLHNSNGRGAREKVERIFNAMIAAAPPTTPAGSGKGE